MNKSAQGFTLIEVLIALAILAIALVAVIKVSAQSVAETSRIKQKLAAHWVALNALARVQTGLIDLNKVTNPSGEESMLGNDWHWQVEIDSDAVSKTYLRVTITVSDQATEKPFETLHGFVRLTHA